MRIRPAFATLAAIAIVLVGHGNAASAKGSTVCTGVLTGTVNSNLTVPPGQECTLVAAQVNGNVRVADSTAVLNITGGVTLNGNIGAPPNTMVQIYSMSPNGGNTINGNVASALVICGATIHGNVSMSGNTFEDALGGSEPGAACQIFGGGNTIAGNVSITNGNPGAFRMADNQIDGNATISGITGTATKRVLNNSIRGTLTCLHDDQPVVASGNTASKTVGQCAP